MLQKHLILIIFFLFSITVFTNAETIKCKASYFEVDKAHKYGQKHFIRKSIAEKRQMNSRQLHEYNAHNLSLLYNKLNKIYIAKQFCVGEDTYMKKLINEQSQLEKMITGILVLQKYYEEKMKLGL